MVRIKRGGLEYFAYRCSSFGSSSNRDAQIVIKVCTALAASATY